MKFKTLADYLAKLENTSSRIEITKTLADLFKKAKASEISEIVNLLLGRLAPSYEGVVFNLADKLVLEAISKAFKRDLKETRQIYKKLGDLGEVSYMLSQKSNNKRKDLSVEEVYRVLFDVSRAGGEGSVEKKVVTFSDLLFSLDPLSCKFVTRIPLGKLRLGFSDKTVIDALSWMEAGDKSKRAALERAYEVLPDIAKLSQRVKEKGVALATALVAPLVGIPVMPMLAQRLKSPDEMIKKMLQVSIEPKYDGLRVLIHYKKGEKIRAFTRNLNDISHMFPELERIGESISAKETILDSEAIGLDEKTKKFFDFQTTMQRRRKHEIISLSSKIPLVFNIFDILLLDGKNLMQESYLARREVLQKNFKETKSFKLTPYTITSDPEVIRREHRRYMSQGLEGIIAKKTDAKYVPGRTAYRWVKMKEEEASSGKLSDTLDCVVMGFTAGQGKRVSFGVGQFLAGVRRGEKFVTITKVGTGLSDEQFKELKKRLNKIIVREKPKEYEVHKDLYPDFWVIPKIVVELAGDDLTISPKHTAGYALRFPRLVHFRDDKSEKQVTSTSEVKKLYDLQKK